VKLKVIIEKNETGFFVAEVPALPGCLSQGKTLDEAKENIKEAVEGWLFIERKHGRINIPDAEEIIFILKGKVI